MGQILPLSEEMQPLFPIWPATEKDTCFLAFGSLQDTWAQEENRYKNAFFLHPHLGEGHPKSLLPRQIRHCKLHSLAVK